MANGNEFLPKDILQDEILLRMPLKTLGRFRCVSKKWSSIISDKHFKDSYLKRLSKTRPRVMFTYYHRKFDPRPSTPDVALHSVYQQEEPLLSCGQQHMHLSPDPGYVSSGPVRGLVCLHSPTRVALCNLGIKKIVALPRLLDPGEVYFFKNGFIGYDQTNNVVKVLCKTTRQFYDTDKTEDYRVYTVGSGEVSWRRIIYGDNHNVKTNGLCVDGVLYYGAKCNDNDGKSIVMTFDMSTEEFGVIQLPEGLEFSSEATLVNYNDEIAIVNHAVNDNGEVHFLVWEKNGGGWRDENIVIPHWGETAEDMTFYFKGKLGTGELVFALNWLFRGSHCVLYYDTITQNLRKFPIEDRVNGVRFKLCHTFLDHVDSLMLM